MLNESQGLLGENQPAFDTQTFTEVAFFPLYYNAFLSLFRRILFAPKFDPESHEIEEGFVRNSKHSPPQSKLSNRQLNQHNRQEEWAEIPA